ncbi:hypothetical protein J6590_026217 [Homalodisca vitripennis]|nr:hypothetical protein J6590_026217 [Homalodisca vitripennis]
MRMWKRVNQYSRYIRRRAAPMASREPATSRLLSFIPFTSPDSYEITTPFARHVTTRFTATRHVTTRFAAARHVTTRFAAARHCDTFRCCATCDTFRCCAICDEMFRDCASYDDTPLANFLGKIKKMYKHNL